MTFSAQNWRLSPLTYQTECLWLATYIHTYICLFKCQARLSCYRTYTCTCRCLWPVSEIWEVRVEHFFCFCCNHGKLDTFGIFCPCFPSKLYLYFNVLLQFTRLGIVCLASELYAYSHMWWCVSVKVLYNIHTHILQHT